MGECGYKEKLSYEIPTNKKASFSSFQKIIHIFKSFILIFKAR